MNLPTIKCVKRNVIYLKIETLCNGLLSDLKRELTRENPAYHQMKRMRDRNPQKYGNMRLPPATLSSYEETHDSILIPRGFEEQLRNLSNHYQQSIGMIDATLQLDKIEGYKLNPECKLREYQSRALGSVIMGREGIVVAPCGAGKTVLGVAIASTIGQPTLILVHTTDLMTQWRRELADKALLPTEVGQMGGGTKRRGQVCVGMIQTLIRMPAAELVAFLDHFAVVILDEAHHCPADTFMSVMNLCKARFRYGLTATPKRKDGLEFLMFDTIGPLLAEITHDDLVRAGKSQTCSVKMVQTSFYSVYGADNWNGLIKDIVEDEDRNRAIVQNVVADWNEGHFCLILSDRVGHCREINERLRRQGMNSQLLVGSVPKNIREQVADQARQGLVDAIVATKVADEGLDIPQLSSIHLTCPSGNESKTDQRIGRVRRPIEGKTSQVVDYVDSRVKICLRMAKDRMRFYRKWGFKTPQA